MLRTGQVPESLSGQASDVLATLFARFAPDDGDQGGGSGGAGGGSDQGSGAGTEVGKDGTPFNAERAQRTIDRQNELLKELRDKVKDAEDARVRLKEIEDKDKTDSQRLAGDLESTTKRLTAAEQRAAELEAKYTTTLIRSAIEREAIKAGAVDSEDVFVLLSGKIGGDIKLDDDGSVSGADKAVEALKKAKAHLFGQASNNSSVRGVDGTPDKSGATSRADLKAKLERELQQSGLYRPL